MQSRPYAARPENVQLGVHLMATYGLIELANRRSYGAEADDGFVTVLPEPPFCWLVEVQRPTSRRCGLRRMNRISSIDLFPLTGCRC